MSPPNCSMWKSSASPPPPATMPTPANLPQMRRMTRSCRILLPCWYPGAGQGLAELEAEGTIHLSLVYRGDRENAGKFLAAQNDILLELYPPEPDPEEEPQKNPAETDPAADPGETTETEAPAGPEEVA